MKHEKFTVLNSEIDKEGFLIKLEGTLTTKDDSLTDKNFNFIDSYPCASYKVLEREGNVITKAELIEVSIANSTVDKSILKISEQNLKNKK